MGVRTRRIEKYYQDLLALDSDSGGSMVEGSGGIPEKWKRQIEKVGQTLISKSCSQLLQFSIQQLFCMVVL